MRELKWLESLAPKPPPVDADQRGNLQLLEIIQEKTEYPFWSAAKESLVAPAWESRSGATAFVRSKLCGSI
jgi:hypothetical protein